MFRQIVLFFSCQFHYRHFEILDSFLVKMFVSVLLFSVRFCAKCWQLIMRKNCRTFRFVGTKIIYVTRFIFFLSFFHFLYLFLSVFLYFCSSFSVESVASIIIVVTFAPFCCRCCPVCWFSLSKTIHYVTFHYMVTSTIIASTRPAAFSFSLLWKIDCLSFSFSFCCVPIGTLQAVVDIYWKRLSKRVKIY